MLGELFGSPRKAAVRACGPSGSVTEKFVTPFGPTGCVARTVEPSRNSTVPETGVLKTDEVVVAVTVPGTPTDQGAGCRTRLVTVVPWARVEIGVLQAPFVSEYSNGSVLLTPLVPYPRVDRWKSNTAD